MGIRAGSFQLAVGSVLTRADAEEVARQALQKGANNIRQAFERAWRAQPDMPRALAMVSGDEGNLARASLSVLRCLEDKSHAGAFVAAPCAPWGETNTDGNHVYHLVWPRDLCRIATALLDAGDSAAALRAFRHLQVHQRPDGGWYQNWFLDGTPHWTATELDQVALPILLAWRLGVANCLDHDPYPVMVRPAAQFIIREGPLTQLDRLEDLGGLSPSTLDACIAALIVSAEFAHEAGGHVAARPRGARGRTTGMTASRRGAQPPRATTCAGPATQITAPPKARSPPSFSSWSGTVCAGQRTIESCAACRASTPR